MQPRLDLNSLCSLGRPQTYDSLPPKCCDYRLAIFKNLYLKINNAHFLKTQIQFIKFDHMLRYKNLSKF
jgi:hypothetical protein